LAKSATVDPVRSLRFTYSSQQKFTLKDRVLPVRQFTVHSSLITNTPNLCNLRHRRIILT